MPVLNPQPCKAFHADVLSPDGTESTLVTLYQLDCMLERFKEEYPDTPLNEVAVLLESDNADGALPITSISYNTDENKSRKVIIHRAVLESERMAVVK